MSVLLIPVFAGCFLALFLLSGFRIVRPTERALVETFGKYSRFCHPGLNYILPIVQKLYRVNVTEIMADIEPQEIITKNRMNAQVDLVIYYKVRSDEESVKKW